MTTINIRLDRLYPGCISGMAAAIDDDYVQKYTAWLRSPNRNPIDEVGHWYTECVHMNMAGKKFTRLVIDTNSNRCIGAFGATLSPSDPRVAGQRWELGYVIHKDFRNRGIGTIAFRAFFDEFSKSAAELGDVTVTAEICKTNPGSRKLVERLGFSLYDKPPYETWEKLLRDGSIFQDQQLLYWKFI